MTECTIKGLMSNGTETYVFGRLDFNFSLSRSAVAFARLSMPVYARLQVIIATFCKQGEGIFARLPKLFSSPLLTLIRRTKYEFLKLVALTFLILNATMPAFSTEQALSEREKTIISWAEEAVKTGPDKLSPVDIKAIQEMMIIHARENPSLIRSIIPELEPVHDPSVPSLKASPPRPPSIPTSEANGKEDLAEEVIAKSKEEALKLFVKMAFPTLPETVQENVVVPALDKATAIHGLNEGEEHILQEEQTRQRFEEELARRQKAAKEAAMRRDPLIFEGVGAKALNDSVQLGEHWVEREKTRTENARRNEHQSNIARITKSLDNTNRKIAQLYASFRSEYEDYRKGKIAEAEWQKKMEVIGLIVSGVEVGVAINNNFNQPESSSELRTKPGGNASESERSYNLKAEQGYFSSDRAKYFYKKLEIEYGNKKLIEESLRTFEEPPTLKTDPDVPVLRIKQPNL